MCLNPFFASFFLERDYGSKDYGSKDYSTKDYSSKDYSTKDYSTKDYTSGSSSTSASGTRDYTSSRSSTRDYTSTRDYSSKDYSTKDYSSSVSTRDSDTRTSYRDRLADLDAKYNLTTSPTAKKGGVSYYSNISFYIVLDKFLIWSWLYCIFNHHDYRKGSSKTFSIKDIALFIFLRWPDTHMWRKRAFCIW